MSRNSSESDDSALKEPPRKKLCKNSPSTQRFQKFHFAWRNKKDYGKWLKPDPNNQTRAIYTVCDNKSMKADIGVIEKHADSTSHTKKGQKSIRQFTDNKNTEKNSGSSSAKRAEIKIRAFMVEHNLSFGVMARFINLLKDCYPDSKILQEVQLKPTKAKAFVKNVIAESQIITLFEKLKKTKFSILIDESTDVSAIQTLCIVVRFYDSDERKIVSRFWKLHQIFGREEEEPEINSSDVPSSPEIVAQAATAKHLFKYVVNSFNKYNISFNNVIGYASDGCNTMMGVKNSVAIRFRQKCPGISKKKCICHSMHLCASEAFKVLPRTCEDLARDVYNCFKSSSKRQDHFQKF